MKKIIEKKLQATKRRVAREWEKYRKQKSKIKKDKSLDFFDKSNEIKSLIQQTRKSISSDFADYREKKFLIVHKTSEPYFGFKYDRKFSTQHTNQVFVKVKNKDIQTFNTNRLDEVIPKIFDKKNVSGVGLVLKVEYKDTGEIGHVSKFYTRLGIKRIKERGKTLFEDLENKLSSMSTKSSQEYKLKGIYIRIIYEKSSTSSK